MTTGVKVRKRGAAAKAHESWDDAIIECARELEAGKRMVVHERGCPGPRGAVCDCVGHMVGPAIREPQ